MTSSPCPHFASVPLVINSVLANLEVSLCFRGVEVQVAALLGRKPLAREDVNLRSEEKHVIVYVNDAYPRCDFKLKKQWGKRKIKMTPFLKLNSEATDKFSTLVRQDRPCPVSIKSVTGRDRDVEIYISRVIEFLYPHSTEDDEAIALDPDFRFN